MKHRKGTYTFASGDVIDATWKKDVCISGTYKYVEDKNTYKGRFKHTDDQLIDVGYKVISDYIMSLQYKNEDQEYTDTNEQVRDKVYPILLGRFVHEYQKYAIQAGTNIYTNIIVWSELDYCNMYQGLPSPWKDGEIGNKLYYTITLSLYAFCKYRHEFVLNDTEYKKLSETVVLNVVMIKR